MRDIGFGILAAILLVVSVLAIGVATNEGDPAPSSPSSPQAAPSAAAGPDQRNADFLAALGGQVTSVSPYAAQLMGERVCTALDDDTPIPEVRKVLMQKGLTEAEASRVILAAVTMYCDENHDKVIR